MRPEIPAIDFGRFLAGSARDRHQAASDIDDALRSVGFVYLLNHGIDQAKIDTYFAWSRRLFSLSAQEKEEFRPPPGNFDGGYFGIQDEKIRGKTCMKESFSFGGSKDSKALGCWPREEQLPGFYDFAVDFHQVCTELMDKLLECLSMALGLDRDHSLAQCHTGSMSVSSLMHYPAVSAQSLRSGEVLRNPAHSDFGTLTLLFQQDVGGLQVADMSSTDKTTSAAVERCARFIDVDPKPGAIVLNIGYLLMRWTNGRWKSTVHRVSEPSYPVSSTSTDSGAEGREIPERFSAAFFGFPDAATVVVPLSTCCSETRPMKWSPINAGEYLAKKRADTYAK